ncbi:MULTISPECIES: hypothetical protein [Streptomyces]|uniref:hypothetical protein n=1 Tax=Streptomyces TaxID=1883 RepID=UPI001E63E2B3|nr:MULTISPECIES: hypothetical protein [Streptomyces]MCD7444830.1 hypothetical protein [Streptomyces lincolnensis]WUB42646.1 hypothetical protein OHN19_04570 [Streptomyces griseorubiginosus]WUB51165.1 hypothetical protein OG942_04565 [Streptomyces griseorubiginosus]
MGVRAARLAQGHGSGERLAGADRVGGGPVDVRQQAGAQPGRRTAAYSSSPKSQGSRDVMPWKPPMS